MTIKKPMSVKRPTVQAAPLSPAEGAPEAPANAAPAAATIADRFKLDIPDPSAKKAGPAGISAKLAVVAGVVALVVAGILAFVLYQHFEYLQGA